MGQGSHAARPGGVGDALHQLLLWRLSPAQLVGLWDTPPAGESGCSSVALAPIPGSLTFGCPAPCRAPPAPVAALLSPVLWRLNVPDRFDMYSVGMVLLQVRLFLAA